MTTPTFTSASYNIAQIPSSLVLADVTGDGNLDIVTSDDPATLGATTYTGGFTVLAGNGNGTFQAPVEYTNVVATNGATVVPYLFPQSIATAVLSKGAAPSIITDDRNGAIAVLSGYSAPTATSAGGWSSVVEYTPATSGILYPNAITTGDLLGNGSQDIVAAEGSGNVAVLMNDGSGAFSAATLFTDGSDPVQVALADMNGDGVLDAVTVDGITGVVSVLNGAIHSGTFSFGAPTVIGSLAAGYAPYSITTVVVGGKTDVVVANITGGVTVFTPTTAKSESAYTSTNYVDGTGPISIAAADVNGDGISDLVVAENGSGSSVNVLLGGADGTFGAPVTIAAGGTPDAVAVGDVNKDGKPDIVYTNSNFYANASVGVLLNTTTLPATNPTITGASAGQTTLDYYPIAPFAAASIGNIAAGASVSLKIAVDNSAGAATDANGILSGAGLTKTGVGAYTLSASGASAANLISELEALSFAPTQHEVAAGKTVTTSFALTLTETTGAQTLTAANSATSVVVTALNYINGPSNGFGYITGTTGADVITASGYFNTITANGGNDIISAGASNACVNVSSGNVALTLGGSFNSVSGGNGTDTVSGASGGYSSISLGNGGDTVSIAGMHDTITLGNGNNVVSGTQGMAFITTGAGADVITVGGSNNTINAGGGANTITGGSAGCDTFVVCAAGQGIDTIKGFSETNNDALDIRSALSAAHYTGFLFLYPPLANYLKVTDTGGNTVIGISNNGTGAVTTVAVLQGVSYGLNDLVSHHSLITV